MGYVMVPVPEEHVQEAMALILRLTARANLRDWDQESVSELFHAVDEPTRSVISVVARAAAAQGPISDVAAADSIEMTQRELLGICREVNERAQDSSHPGLVSVKMEQETLPNGRTREQRMVSMDRGVAELVRQAEREELAASADPLLGDRG